jgi:hypothetical protein
LCASGGGIGGMFGGPACVTTPQQGLTTPATQETLAASPYRWGVLLGMFRGVVFVCVWGWDRWHVWWPSMCNNASARPHHSRNTGDPGGLTIQVGCASRVGKCDSPHMPPRSRVCSPVLFESCQTAGSSCVTCRITSQNVEPMYTSTDDNQHVVWYIACVCCRAAWPA